MEFVIGALIVGALLYFNSNAAPPAGVVTPSLPGAVPSPIVPSSVMVSGGYQLTSESTMLASGVVGLFGPVSGASQGSIAQPTTLPPPPPYVSGGIAGSVGSGGNPLGGALVPGVSAGSPTTSLPTPAYTNLTVAQAKALQGQGYTIVGGNAYAPGQAPVAYVSARRAAQVIA